MNGTRKDALHELDDLKERLRRLLQSNSNEFQYLETRLRQAERKIEDNFAKLDSFQTDREELGKRFRKSAPRPVSAIEPLEPDRSQPVSP